jgi:hypothetical protein
MADNLQPIPQNPIGESFVWRDWFQRLSNKVFGTASTVDLPISIPHGGTGQITANTAINALLPDQTGNAGKVLGTNGANTSWVTGGGGSGTTSVLTLSLDTEIHEDIMVVPGPMGPQGPTGATGPAGSGGGGPAVVLYEDWDQGEIMAVHSPLWPGGGALQNWTEGVSTAAPNATVPVVSFIPKNSATNVDTAVAPKGTGAFLAAIPDNGVAGGSKRGANAVDLQTIRTAAASVAQADYSVMLGGYDNSVTNTGATYSVLAGGRANTQKGQYGVIGGGIFNSVEGTRGTIGGGLSNIAWGSSVVGGGESNTAGQTSFGGATVGGGFGNLADGYASCIPGGSYATTRGWNGVFAYSASNNYGLGSTQWAVFQVKIRTTDATPTLLWTDSAVIGTPKSLNLIDQQTTTFEGLIAARKQAGSELAGWRITGVANRNAGAATCTLSGLEITRIYASSGATAWVVAVTANTTGGVGGVDIKVTGTAATNVQWTGTIHCTESVYA